MTVLWNERTTPLAPNSANTAFSNNINLAWDFTAHDAAHAGGVPWVFVGATPPTLAVTGSQTLTTVNGEPGLVPGASSLLDYTSTTNYGMQSGTGDFTIGIRLTTAASLPAGSNSREILRISGASGTALSVVLLENPGVGYYVNLGGSSVLPIGAAQSAVFYPANTTIMVWVVRTSNVVTLYTQNVTAQTNAVLRYAGGAAAGDLNASWAARTITNFNSTATTPAMQSITHWTVAHSQATLSLIGKNFYDTQANAAAVDAITITSPSTGNTIAATSVISGTYTGTQPAGVEVQFGANGWVAGTGMSISLGAWSGTFALTAGGPSSMTAREANAVGVVSAAVTSVTVVSSAIAFAGNGLTADEAVAFRVFQRNGSNLASVRLKGTYIGAPASIEYSFDGGAWTTLVASPSGGVFNAVVSLAGPAQGPLSVRFSDNTGVVGTLSAVGVGDVFMVAGQSNHVGGGAGTYVPADIPGAHPAWRASILDKTGRWRENVETATDQFSKTTNASIYGAASATYPVQAGSATAYNSYFGKLASLFMASGIPVAFVPSALGSTSISTWAVSTSTSTLYGAMLARATAIGVTKVLWWQGEQDCLDGTTKTAYTAALNALVNDWCGTRFPGAKWVLMNLNATGNAAGTGGAGASDTGFNAVHAAIEAVAAGNSNVAGIADMNGAFSSSIHYATAPEIATIAGRAFAAITATQVYADIACNYAVAQLVAVDLAASYGVAAAVSADLSGAYSVGALVSADLPVAYSVAALVSADLPGAYSIRSQVGVDLMATYAFEGVTTTVSADLLGEYSVAALVGANFPEVFAVNALVRADLAASYAVQSEFAYARAPAGSGYTPQRAESTTRPAATQRNYR